MKPNPPECLTDATAALWLSLWESWSFSAPERQTLLLGLQAVDRAEAARLAVAKDGDFVIDRYGQVKAHPGVAIQHTALGDWLAVQRELQLVDGDDTRKNKRPDNRPPRPAGRYERT